MTARPVSTPADPIHAQELRIALVMNGGVSLAVWIGGVTQEINRLVRGDGVYGRLCTALRLLPRVDVISGTSAGGINGALLALAMSQGKSLDALRDIWLEKGDLLTLLRQPLQDDPPSLLDGGYFYKAMRESFEKIAAQAGAGLQPPAQVPIELTLTTTILHGEVADFADDTGALIRDVTHRGLIQFRRGPDHQEDPFAAPDIAAKLATAARATASFPGAFEPFYLPAAGEKASAGGEPVACLQDHANFNDGWAGGRFVVDGGVLDNNPLESAIEAVFNQRAEIEVRRVLAYVVPDPGHVADPPSQKAAEVPTMVSTALAALVSIPRVESVSEQLRAIREHNRTVARQRDSRLLVARSLDGGAADRVVASVFPGYRLRRTQGAADYIAAALAEGAARHRDASDRGRMIGRRARRRIAAELTMLADVPWVPPEFSPATTTGQGPWRWGLFTLGNALSVVLDLLRRAVGLVPAHASDLTEPTWKGLLAARRQGFDLVARLAELRKIEKNHWLRRGKELAPELVALDRGDPVDLRGRLSAEMRGWVQQFGDTVPAGEALQPPRAFAQLADAVARLFADAVPLVAEVLTWGVPPRSAEAYTDLTTLMNFLSPPAAAAPAPAEREPVASAVEAVLEGWIRGDDQPEPALPAPGDGWARLLMLEVVHFAFNADAAREQHLELILFSANVPTAFDGPDRLEQKLAGVQVAHFGAFYKRSWRINDWMFGRLDGAERLLRIVLDPARLCRLYGREAGVAPVPGTAVAGFVEALQGVVLGGIERDDDRRYLEALWAERQPALNHELAFLEAPDGLPEHLPECSRLLRARLHLDILRAELPALADAVGDDEVAGADAGGFGSMFLKRFRGAYCGESGAPRQSPPDLATAQLVALFKGARVGEEKVLEEVGTDRFTLIATRSAAVAVSALAGKGAGLRWLRGVFATIRAPLILLDLFVRALMKRGGERVFVTLYAMAMVASATVLIAERLARAQWPGGAAVTTTALVILGIGAFVALRRHPRLLFGLALLVLLLWKGLPLLGKFLA